MRALALAALLGCLPAAAFAGPESWSSLRALGGISVGPPFSSRGGWLLVVHATLSRPNTDRQHPAPACSSTKAVVEGNNIYLTVISGPATSTIASVCPAARIGELQSGPYKVFYRGPDEPPVLLKEVQFP